LTVLVFDSNKGYLFIKFVESVEYLLYILFIHSFLIDVSWFILLFSINCLISSTGLSLFLDVHSKKKLAFIVPSFKGLIIVGKLKPNIGLFLSLGNIVLLISLTLFEYIFILYKKRCI
jgi:hypothetical protein